MKSVLKLTVLSEDTAAVLEYSPAQKINLLSGYLFSFFIRDEQMDDLLNPKDATWINNVQQTSTI